MKWKNRLLPQNKYCTCLLKYKKPFGQLTLTNEVKHVTVPSIPIGCILNAPLYVMNIQCGYGPHTNT